jgi:hypothetical protein
MRRRIVQALGSLALGCLASPVVAGDPGYVAPVSQATAPVVYGSASPAWGGEPAHDDGFHLLAGAGIYYIHPIFESNRALSVVTVPGVPTAPVSFESRDFDYNFDVSPRFWLGFTCGDGWGLRASYWHYDESSSTGATLNGATPPGSAIVSAAPLGQAITTPTLLLAPGNSDVLTAHTNLKLNVWDFEIVKEAHCGCLDLLGSVGGRYAQIRQRYDADLSNTANNPAVLAETEALRSGQRFNGAGPTASLEGDYHLGDSGFLFYGLARGTVLVGHYYESANTGITVTAAGVPAAIPLTVATFGRDAAVPEGEIEAGVGWEGRMSGLKPFVRLGVVAQNYWNVLNNNNVVGINPSPNTLNGDLTFFGMTATCGFSF